MADDAIGLQKLSGDWQYFCWCTDASMFLATQTSQIGASHVSLTTTQNACTCTHTQKTTTSKLSFLFEIILNRFVKFKIFVQELVFYTGVHMCASTDVASVVLVLKPFGADFMLRTV